VEPELSPPVNRVDQRVETAAGIGVQGNGAADDRSRGERNQHECFDRHVCNLAAKITAPAVNRE